MSILLTCRSTDLHDMNLRPSAPVADCCNGRAADLPAHVVRRAAHTVKLTLPLEWSATVVKR